jgi:hypothetical protein
MSMLTFVAALVGFVVFAVALALGAIACDRPLRGSCGGGCLCNPVAARACPRRRAGAGAEGRAQ